VNDVYFVKCKLGVFNWCWCDNMIIWCWMRLVNLITWIYMHMQSMNTVYLWWIYVEWINDVLFILELYMRLYFPLCWIFLTLLVWMCHLHSWECRFAGRGSLVYLSLRGWLWSLLAQFYCFESLSCRSSDLWH